MADMKDKDLAGDSNPDPLTGAPGSHPVGVGVGTAGGAAAGAAVGAVGGPVGSAVGAVVGGVAGGLAGKGAAEAVNPTAEDAYWRSNYATRPYVTPGSTYDTYRPAYQYGWESYAQYEGRRFDEVEINDARHIIYIPIIGFLLLYAFYLTIVLAQMADRVQELITHTAILEKRVRDLDEKKFADGAAR